MNSIFVYTSIYIYIDMCMYLPLCCLACKVGAMIWSHPGFVSISTSSYGGCGKLEIDFLLFH